MTKVILYIWIETGKPFGIFTSTIKAEQALKKAAKDIKKSLQDLKADLYYYELPLNKLVITEYDTILEY